METSLIQSISEMLRDPYVSISNCTRILTLIIIISRRSPSSSHRKSMTPSILSSILFRDFAKDSIRLVKHCHKPDRKGEPSISYIWLSFFFDILCSLERPVDQLVEIIKVKKTYWLFSSLLFSSVRNSQSCVLLFIFVNWILGTPAREEIKTPLVVI
ncbi:unnamed protein product [Thlaspi arvense]|uniref:Uncharacterized protein n=1 Tax=Thlaspi arvense TaxID=13288 RepID=A0AAU9T7N9_THLAR|nr:unnamed protein product [Thlaspi arvense]